MYYEDECFSGTLWYNSDADRLMVEDESCHAGDTIYIDGQWLRVEYLDGGWMVLSEDGEPVWLPLGLEVQLWQR